MYLNGLEVARSNMPPGDVDARTPAAADVWGEDEDVYHPFSLPPELLVAGENVIAVEVHQSSSKSKDLGFDLALLASLDELWLERAPYLQKGTPSSVVVRWRTTIPSDSRLLWGSSPGSLTHSLVDSTLSTEHELEITGLPPATTVYYAVGTTKRILAGGDVEHAYTTPPPPGTRAPIRIWVIGDSGSCEIGRAHV